MPPSESWPIGAALLQFRPFLPNGTPTQDANGEQWAFALAELAGAGFDHVDLTDTWVRPGDLTGSRLDELSSAVRQAGLGITAISTARRSIIDPDPRAALDNLHYLHRTIDAAASIGAPVVCAGFLRALTPAQLDAEWFWLEQGASDPAGDEDTWALAVTRIRELGHHAESLGVRLSLEMYEDTYLGTAASAVRLVEEVGVDAVGLNPDVGNLVRQHRPIEQWEDVLRQTLPHTNYWHIKNYYRDHDPRTGAYFTVPAPAQSGLINYRLALGMALDVGFDGPICVEHYGGDGISVSATNRDYLRTILAEKLAERQDGALTAAPVEP